LIPRSRDKGSSIDIKALHPPAAAVPRRARVANLGVDELAAAIVAVIGEAVAPLRARIAALEQQPALKFAGPFRDGTHYLAGSIVQKQGLWLAESDTHAPPGAEDSGWKLILKVAPK
jgi:hypothetical protein